MTWDDELKVLATYVRTHLGEDVIKAASGRAMAALNSTHLATTQDADADDVIVAPNGTVYAIDAYHEAFRRELRRLAQPQ